MKKVLLGLLFCLSANAQSPQQTPQQKATLDLEWEAVAEAAGYEIELTPKEGGSALRFQSEQNTISQMVPVGSYLLRIRSKESSSGIYGSWSTPTEVDVAAKQIEPLAPEDNAVMQAGKKNVVSIEFKWNPAPGAKFYTLRVWPDDEAKAKEFKTKKTALRVRLSGLRRYKWYVSFETEQVNYSAELKARTFVVQGPELERPVINRIELPSVTQISWSAPKDAETYDAAIKQRFLDEADWREYRTMKDVKETSWKFEKLPPGAYVVTVTAHSQFRASAESHSVQFVVKLTQQELENALKLAIGAKK